MDWWSRISSAGVLVATVTCCGAGSARVAAREWDTRPLTVVMYNHAGVDAVTVTYAEAVMSETYRRAGIEIAWVDADVHGDAATYYVNLVTSDMPPPEPVTQETVGFATPGSLAANVIYDRIRAIARSRHVPCGVMLGYVMAHELGHLLLPAHSHSESGVMRAALDLDLAAARNLRFTDRQALLMHERLTGLPAD